MAKSKKVNKWEAAPESIRKLKEAINGTVDGLSIAGGLDDPNEWERELIDILKKVLDDYNELETKHNADCGLISKLEEENEDLESKLDSVTRERNHAEHILTELIEQLKIKNDVYVNLEVCINGVYEIEDKRAADLQEDLDAAILNLKEEEESVECLKKQIIRKNADMCNLKWERDETEKKIEILTEELMRLYGIHVTFYQKPGYDAHGIRNFGVNVNCEENRKAFNELKEALDKHKSQIDKLETKRAKATRYISALTKALNNAGVEFHYVKIGDDGEAVFRIDSVIDKCAKKHYEEQYDRLRDIIKNYEKDRREIDHRNFLLLRDLDRAGIRPTFDKLDDKWLIQYTDKAENAFLAADQIKRDAEKKIDKLVSALSKCNLEAKWDYDDRTWHVYVMSTGQIVKSIVVDYCKVFEYVNELKDEIEKLKTELDDLKSKNRSWQVSYNAVEKKAKEATAVIDGLNDYAEALKGRIQELEDRSKDIYKLAVDGYNNMSVFEYTAIADILRCKHRLTCPVVCDCTNCKNYDPRE